MLLRCWVFFAAEELKDLAQSEESMSQSRLFVLARSFFSPVFIQVPPSSPLPLVSSARALFFSAVVLLLVTFAQIK